MKFKTTQKAIKGSYNHVIKVSYCRLQYLLNYLQPVAYTARAEGWASDVYDIGGGYALSTGYAPFGDIKLSYDYLKALDNKAMQTIQNASDPVAELAILLDELKNTCDMMEG